MPKVSQLLALLRHQEKQTYLSGEELSEKLGVSRTAIWKYIHQLEELGYAIAGVPHLGYQLLSTPDSLLPDEIRHGLKTKKFGHSVAAYKETTSTNDRALELAAGHAAEGTLVTAELQTRGRGRRDRRWLSPANANLLFTLILRPAWSVEQASLMTLLMAVALAKTIRLETGLLAQIKWPNDILIRGRKVAGILTEMRIQANEIEYVACGIGVNVNHAPSGALHIPAASLTALAGHNVPRLPLLRHFLAVAEQLYFQAQSHGFSAALAEWENFSMMIGKQVMMEVADTRQVEGVVMGVDDSGALLLRLENGMTQRFTSGDCRLVKMDAND